ncbi:hypothetical protein KFK09_013637 [Dendrobium nobile]|uniref:Uncharacterized protein n=1 Tax=Dendrobium nobile TaxID=94219 RepID=A0A8T3BA78_DENNO|nr:hypothetical protein KFK09_013637 [Dendrobium nobile]
MSKIAREASSATSLLFDFAPSTTFPLPVRSEVRTVRIIVVAVLKLIAATDLPNPVQSASYRPTDPKQASIILTISSGRTLSGIASFCLFSPVFSIASSALFFDTLTCKCLIFRKYFCTNSTEFDEFFSSDVMEKSTELKSEMLLFSGKVALKLSSLSWLSLSSSSESFSSPEISLARMNSRSKNGPSSSVGKFSVFDGGEDFGEVTEAGVLPAAFPWMDL